MSTQLLNDQSVPCARELEAQSPSGGETRSAASASVSVSNSSEDSEDDQLTMTSNDTCVACTDIEDKVNVRTVSFATTKKMAKPADEAPEAEPMDEHIYEQILTSCQSLYFPADASSSEPLQIPPRLDDALEQATAVRKRNRSANVTSHKKKRRKMQQQHNSSVASAAAAASGGMVSTTNFCSDSSGISHRDTSSVTLDGALLE